MTVSSTCGQTPLTINAMETTLADAFFAFPNVLYLVKILTCQLKRVGEAEKNSHLVRKSIDMVPYQNNETCKSNVLWWWITVSINTRVSRKNVFFLTFVRRLLKYMYIYMSCLGDGIYFCRDLRIRYIGCDKRDCLRHDCHSLVAEKDGKKARELNDYGRW